MSKNELMERMKKAAERKVALEKIKRIFDSAKEKSGN